MNTSEKPRKCWRWRGQHSRGFGGFRGDWDRSGDRKTRARWTAEGPHIDREIALATALPQPRRHGDVNLGGALRLDGKAFEAFLPSRDWTGSIFDSVERSRNVIMHSGNLGPRDIERIGIHIRDWITQVGA